MLMNISLDIIGVVVVEEQVESQVICSLTNKIGSNPNTFLNEVSGSSTFVKRNY